MNTTLPPINVKHFCNPGDLIASMAGLKSYYEANGTKIQLLQQLDIEANYYEGAQHGTTNAAGKMVCMNQKIFDMIKPLVESQEYIHGMEEYVGQEPIRIDIDVIRKKLFVNLPHGLIQCWVMYAFPDLAYDLSKAWIILKGECPKHVGEQVNGKILLNFTERYRNGHINYYFLRKFKHRIVFAGTDREHLLFCNRWKLDVPKLQVNDFLELAHAIKNCKYLLANQSMIWNLAEAMKTPRILEVCEFAQNCAPFIGEKSYGYFHQEAVEYYVDIMTC